MDEYAKEIADLEAQIEAMADAEEDPKVIAESEMERDVLRAIYRQAQVLFDMGRPDRNLQAHLVLRGYGPWTLDNVYAFTYETAVDLPAATQRDFIHEIGGTDFAGLLQDGPFPGPG
ncbi:MAG TPA: hypothetical protein VG015_07950 [Candidatus Dormibacteraeota bacterium]|nr:hypothetical protein [Candidatus Dormibacteraeota bacterium]